MSSRFRWLTIPVLLLSSALTLTYLYFFQAALTEDRNHLKTHAAIMSLELTRAAAVKLGGDEATLLTRNFSSLDTHLAQSNWEKVDQFGAGVVYNKRGSSNERLFATCGLYSRLYLICDLSKNSESTQL